MHKIEIYWQDLTEKKQKEILDEFNETEEFGNWDVIPMATLEIEDDENCDCYNIDKED